MKRVLAAAALTLTPLFAAPLHAQTGRPAAGSASATSSAEPAPSASAVAMHRLDFLLGEWEGDGWIIAGRDGRRTFHQRETVRPAAGGTVVIIDGLGTSTDAGRKGAIVHQAFALVSYDSAGKAYRWRAFRATGDETATVPAISDNTIVWGMDVGPVGHASHVRFTIELTPQGTWHEVGDFLQPDAASDAAGVRFFEMTLHKRATMPSRGDTPHVGDSGAPTLP